MDAGDSDEEGSCKKRGRCGKESDSEDDGSDDERPRKNRKKGLFGFTDIEIRKFVKSFRKFAAPLTRFVVCYFTLTENLFCLLFSFSVIVCFKHLSNFLCFKTFIYSFVNTGWRL